MQTGAKRRHTKYKTKKNKYREMEGAKFHLFSFCSHIKKAKTFSKYIRHKHTHTQRDTETTSKLGEKKNCNFFNMHRIQNVW